MEEWKSIDNHPEYKVSNLGRVKSIKYNKEIILKQTKNNTGYYYVYLSEKSKKYPLKVHRLIAHAFIPNPDNKPFIDHINRKRDDNSINNLKWVNNSENMVNTDTRSNTNQKNIHQNKRGTYEVFIVRNYKVAFCKTYKTLEEAVKVRDDFLKNYKDDSE